MKQYLESLGSDTEREAYAKRTGSSVGYLNHIARGDREPKKLKFIIDLIEGSGGKLTLTELCPELFAGASGRKYERMLVKALTPVVRAKVAKRRVAA